MKNENHMITRTIQLLKKHYLGNTILLVLFFLFVLFQVLPLFSVEQAVSVTLERYIIMIVILAIPFSLKLFAHRIKKAVKPVDTAVAIQLYKRASFLRLYTLSVVTLALIILFAYSRDMNFFWLTVVLFVVFLFCKPSREELQSITEAPEDQILSEEESRNKNPGRESIEEESGMEKEEEGKETSLIERSEDKAIPDNEKEEQFNNERE